jgi:hypothetical protein
MPIDKITRNPYPSEESRMKIASSDIQMVSNREYIEKRQKSEKLNIWIGKRPEQATNSNQVDQSVLSKQQLQKMIQDKVNLSIKQQASSDYSSIKPCKSCSSSEDIDSGISLIERMIEIITGKKIRIKIFKPVSINTIQPGDIKDPNNQQQKGWGIEYDSHESYTEAESTSFSSEGTIKTSDGGEIKFKLDIQMSRAYSEEKDISFKAGDAVPPIQKDPLVINFNGSTAELTDSKFEFDIDADGTQDNISFLKSGSGFLVLDKNHDGKVNDGSELFGPKTGNGFSELSAYDEDQNNWIDENDSIYDQLSIWTKNEAGEDQLSSLKEKNVGAIYLSNISTQFDIKNSTNQKQGEIESTGVYVDENGSVKTIQNLNLTV